MKKEDAIARICVALDVPDGASAMKLVQELDGEVGFFKIGMELFTAEGPSVVRDVVAAGANVFLDLKFHDIPNTVAGATRSAARLGVSIVDVHAAGGPEMLSAALRGATDGAALHGRSRPKVVAITVLTSIDQQGLKLVTGADEDLTSQVVRLARMAQDAGLDGVVASPQEIEAIRSACGPDFLIITPGIRAAGAAHQDQRRVLGPSGAIAAGANILVIGRPITRADDPKKAAESITVEIAGA